MCVCVGLHFKKTHTRGGTQERERERKGEKEGRRGPCSWLFNKKTTFHRIPALVRRRRSSLLVGRVIFFRSRWRVHSFFFPFSLSSSVRFSHTATPSARARSTLFRFSQSSIQVHAPMECSHSIAPSSLLFLHTSRVFLLLFFYSPGSSLDDFD